MTLAAVLLLASACESNTELPEPTPTVGSPAPSEPAKDAPPECDRNNIDCTEALGQYLAALAGFTDETAASAFTVSYQVCHTFEPEEFVAQGFDSGGSTEPEAVAQAYAAETYQEAYEQAGYEGCLAGFRNEP